jgi:REP element-mobilizing transposase RayT
VREVIGGVLSKAGAVLHDYEGGPGHVVVTVTAPPTADLPGLIATLKRASARWLRSHGADLLAGPAPGGLQFWDRNYVILSVGEWVDATELLRLLEPAARERRRASRGR